MTYITLKHLLESLLQRIRHLASPTAPAHPQAPAWSQDIRSQVAAWKHLAGGWISDEPVEVEIAAIYAARTAGREVSR